MKIAISYFYQIRNFKKNMIPVSTALYDPLWYHDFTRDYNYIFKDKRGIINGIRCEAIIEQAKTILNCKCPCKNKDSFSCSFLFNYRKKLENINFKKLYKDIEELAKRYQEQEKIEEEIIIVFIVYETPSNLCSERQSLIDYFNSNGVKCEELTYPII